MLLYCICEESSLVLDNLLRGQEMIMVRLDNFVQIQFLDNGRPKLMATLT